MEVLQALYGEGLTEDYLMPTLELNRSLLKSMAQYERFAKQHKLNLNSLLVLLVLYYAKGTCSQQLVSKTLWLPKQTVGSILAGLKMKGYTQEAVSPVDARAKTISLTDEGARFCEEVFASLHRLESEALQGTDVEDIKAATRSVDAYAEAFGRGLDELGEG
ncbi:hypothetical protein C1867_10085 [Eggerthella lenta]|nr:hypothetical protein C1867_10085 [Eggerthella lenta]